MSELVGTPGNDTLDGAGGYDILTGGQGADTFRFSSLAGISNVQITDFGPGDRIDLTGLGATFIGTAAFTGTAGNPGAAQVRLRMDTSTTLEIDTDGNGSANHYIYLNNGPGLEELAGSPGILVRVPDRTLNGTSADDTLDGGIGRDTISGGAGNDLLRGLAGNDTMSGGEGDDILEDGLGSDTMTGGAGNDTFRIVAPPAGTTFNYATVSSTTIIDFTQGDRIDLSALKATFIGENSFSGNTVNGGTGKAEVRLRSDYVGTTMLEIDSNGDGLADRTISLNGSHGLAEQAGAPGILVRVPNRVVTGAAADDVLDGGGGADSISGGAGNDLLSGLGGNDTLNGDYGDDVLNGGPGRDSLTGGNGNDTFRFDGFGDIGSDLITDFTAGDRIDLSALNVTFIGDGTFTGSTFSPGPAQVRYRADVTSTTLEFDSNGDGFVDRTVTLSGAHALGELAGSPRVLVRLDDRSIVGTVRADTLNGGAGFDSLWGGGGNDVLNGLGGGDVLNGGAGDDTLNGGEGADLLIGGEGNDTFRFTASTQLAGDRITDFATGDRIDLSALNVSFIGEDPFTGNPQYPGPGQVRLRAVGDDTQLEFDTTGDGRIDGSIVLSGEHGLAVDPNAPGVLIRVAERLRTGTDGNDTLEGAGSRDTLSGGAGDDTLIGYAGSDSLDGGAGNDLLYGGSGADLLRGGLGDDTLDGGAGVDQLMGGDGKDTFRFASVGDILTDSIGDFGDGDRIDLSALNAVYIGSAQFSGTPGASSPVQVRSVVAGGMTRVEIASSGYPYANSYFTLVGEHDLVADPQAAGMLVRVSNQTLAGTDGDDSLVGGTARDTLTGGGGNDTLVGGGGVDLLQGGLGADVLIGGDGADSLDGGAGDDRFVYDTPSAMHNDRIRDFTAGDRLDLSALGATFIGESQFSGKPAALGSAQLRLFYGTDSTTLVLDSNGDGTGDAVLTLDGVVPLVQLAGAPAGVLVTEAGQALTGGDGNDSLTGASGPDTLTGGAGSDTLSGDYGNDLVIGGDGNDVLSGGDGIDTLEGGAGNDTVNGGPGGDLMTGGAGRDAFRFNKASHVDGDRITDFSSSDRIDITDLNATFIGTAAFTGTTAQPGPAQVNVVVVGSGPLAETRLVFDLDGNGVGERFLILSGTHTLATAQGSPGVLVRSDDLVLAGTGDADTLEGGAGRDSLTGDAGNDSLTGGAGNDTLNGGDGDDTLAGSEGRDELAGGAGNDTFLFARATDIDGDLITDFATGDRIDLSGLSANFLGTTPLSQRYGSGVAVNVVQTGSGAFATTDLQFDVDGDGVADRVIHIAGIHALAADPANTGVLTRVTAVKSTGGGGADTLTGGAASDTLAGGDGNDRLDGLAGADFLDGGTGDDTLAGGAGEDVLTGGDGNDTFRYASAAEADGDRIADFALGDRLDLSGLAFTYVGSGPFTGTTAQRGGAQVGIRFVTSGGSATQVLFDMNGDGVADGTLTLAGFHDLQEAEGSPGVLVQATGLTLTGTADADTLTGAETPDRLSGQAGGDWLFGNGGNDSLSGGQGNDSLNGGDGADLLSGDAGDDTLNGGAGDDTLNGGDGNDRFEASGGTDDINGGAGTDAVVFTDAWANYDIANNGTTITVTHARGTKADGVARVTAVEELRFTDKTVDLTPASAIGSRLISGLGGTAGFGENELDRSNDGSSGFVDVRSIFADGINVAGKIYTGFYINTNGSISFDGPLSTGPSANALSASAPAIIAPFLSDVDTRGGTGAATPGGTSQGTNRVYYDLDPATGTIIVTWDDVAANGGTDGARNAFQLVLTNAAGAAGRQAGDFDAEFRYESVTWAQTGGAGTVAQAGYTAGNGDAAGVFILPQSGDAAGMLALDSTAGNTGSNGLWRFSMTGGTASNALPAVVAIEPGQLSKAEGNSGSTRFTFTVTRAGDTTSNVTVGYTVAGTGSSPIGAGDLLGGFLPYDGTVTFAAGETSKTISVDVAGDTVAEANETFAVTLGTPAAGSNVKLGNRQATGTVVNDDNKAPPLPPGFRPGANWGDPHLVTFDGFYYSFQAVGEFTYLHAKSGDDRIVQLRTAAMGDAVSVNTAVATKIGAARVSLNALDAAHPLRIDGVATDIADDVGSVAAGDGQIFRSGNVYTIVYANQEQMIVTVEADRVDLQLFLSPTRAAGSIEGLMGNLDGNASNDLALADGTVLSQPVDYSVLYGSYADGWRVTQQTSLLDYGQGETTATYTDRSFPRQVLSVDTLPDALRQRAEALLDAAGITDPALRQAALLDVALTGDASFLKGATLADAPTQQSTTANAPAAAPVVTIAARTATVTERNSGSTNVVFDVYRTGDSSADLVLDFAVTGFGASAADVADFGGQLPSGTVTLAAGQTSATVTVAVAGDAVAEADESFAVTLSQQANAATKAVIAAPRATVTIENDDGALTPRLDIAATSATVQEGQNAKATFTITRSDNSLDPVSVACTVAGSGPNPAAADDFVAGSFPSGSVSLAAGETTKTIEIAIAADALAEQDETFTVTLSNPSGATIGTAVATGVIKNTAPPPSDPPSLSIAAETGSAAEGNDGTTGLTFLVTRTGDLSGATTVSYTVAGSGAAPATAGDFAGKALPQGTVTFAAGAQTARITENVQADRDVEADETFTVTLSNASGATIQTAAATGTIRNDDVPSGSGNSNGAGSKPVGDETVNGVVVQTRQGSAPTGVNVPFVETGLPQAVPADRRDGATVALMQDAGNAPLLQANVSAGAGLTAYGPQSTVDSSQTAGIFAGMLATVLPDARSTDIRNAVSSFAGSAGGQLTLRTLTPTGAGPVTITGSSAAGAPREALILNMGSNPGGSVVLNEVDFAAIVGRGTFTGGAGNSRTIGDDAAQTINLGPGDDTTSGGGGNDVVVSTTGRDLLAGDAGNDTLHGGDDDDTVMGGDDNDLVGGGAGNDLLTGDEGNDTIVGGDGTDSILGGAGADLLGGGAGDDLIDGGIGNDTLIGEDGNDTLFGGAGDDVLWGFVGDDWLIGGAGKDIFAFTLGGGNDYVFEFNADDDLLGFAIPGISIADLKATAKTVGTSTVFTLSDKSTITVVGVTGVTDAWFQ